LIATLLLFLATSVARAPQGDGPPVRSDGEGLVALELVAGRDAIRPGETFEIGVHLRMEPGWHVYWENAGDAGLPTTARITAPAGFEVGKLRYPAPERHELEGAIVSYIHHDDLLLVADVRAPADLVPGSKARFAVESRWLVCTDVCFAGSGADDLELDVVAPGRETRPAKAELFAAAHARMPRPWSAIAASASVTRTGDDAAPVHKLRVARARALEFFPSPSETTTLASRTVKVGEAGGTVELAWSFEPRTPADRPETRGVLHVRTAEGDAWYSFDGSEAGPAPEKR